MSDPVDVPIQDDVIRLGQFLKLANLIDSGSEAKTVIAEGLVRVNDEVELRRGRQLHAGDVVALAGHKVRVMGAGGGHTASHSGV
ncbi:RNA-binding S4 domain-containing protein [Nocardia sp. NPDC004722]